MQQFPHVSKLHIQYQNHFLQSCSVHAQYFFLNPYACTIDIHLTQSHKNQNFIIKHF